MKRLINNLRIWEIKELPRSTKIWITLFCIWLISNNIINYNIILHHDANFWLYDNIKDLPVYKKVIYYLNTVVSFTGVVSVILLAYGKISTYFWGPINVIAYTVYAYLYGYIGDAELNLFIYMPAQFIGYYMWRNELKGDNKLGGKTVIKKKFDTRMWLLSIIIIIILAVIFYYQIPWLSVLLTGSYAYEGFTMPHVFDCLTNALSVWGTYLMVARYGEQYYLWGIANVLGIAMYAGIAGFGFDLPLVLLMFSYLLITWTGFREWILKEGK